MVFEYILKEKGMDPDKDMSIDRSIDLSGGELCPRNTKSREFPGSKGRDARLSVE